jgi:hypothetical protein
MTIMAAVADFGGRRKFCSKSRPLSSIQFIAGVITFFPGVVDTGQK